LETLYLSEVKILFQVLVALLGRGISSSQGLYPHRTTQQIRRHISMPRAGFKPTIQVFEISKTVRSLDCAAAGIGMEKVKMAILPLKSELSKG